MYGMPCQAFPARSSLGICYRKHPFILTTTTTEIWFQRSRKCAVQTGCRGAMDQGWKNVSFLFIFKTAVFLFFTPGQMLLKVQAETLIAVV